MTPHQCPTGHLETSGPIQTHRTLVAHLYFEVQRFDPERSCFRQREVQHLAANPAAAHGRHEVEVIDKAVTAAILDAVAEREDDVADGSPACRTIHARANGSPVAICATAISPSESRGCPSS